MTGSLLAAWPLFGVSAADFGCSFWSPFSGTTTEAALFHTFEMKSILLPLIRAASAITSNYFLMPNVNSKRLSNLFAFAFSLFLYVFLSSPLNVRCVSRNVLSKFLSACLSFSLWKCRSLAQINPNSPQSIKKKKQFRTIQRFVRQSNSFLERLNSKNKLGSPSSSSSSFEVFLSGAKHKQMKASNCCTRWEMYFPAFRPVVVIVATTTVQATATQLATSNNSLTRADNNKCINNSSEYERGEFRLNFARNKPTRLDNS